MIRSLLFDLGGVVLDSPLDAIAAYEEDNHLPVGSINRGVAARGSSGAWARHERGEIGLAQFCDAFEAEMAAAGFVIDAATLLAQIEAIAVPRPAVLTEISRLRQSGYRVGAVTNNWESMRDNALSAHFDVMVESCVEGVRKPEREIFELALSRLGAEAATTLLLDDIGPNLKTARAMGMETFKVTDESSLLERLAAFGRGSEGA